MIGEMNIHELIVAYRAASSEAVAELRSAYPSFTHPISIKKDGLRRQGTLPSGRSFDFHGIGCRFELGEVAVEVDFGSDGRDDGFDTWRLWLYSEYVCEPRPTYNEVKAALVELERNGELTRPGPMDMGQSLYFQQL